MKKIMLTAYNVSMMDKGHLPIHGAMVNVFLKDGTKKGIVFMGIPELVSRKSLRK